MLSSQTNAIITATMPILHAHGAYILIRMHEIISPDTSLRELYSMNHRKITNYHYDLANIIIKHSKNPLTYASQNTYIRHARLRISPDRPEALANALTQALHDILGKTATPEIIRAWTEAIGPNGLAVRRRCRFWKLWELFRQSEPNAFHTVPNS